MGGTTTLKPVTNIYEPGKIRMIRIVSSNSTLFEKVGLGSAGVIHTTIVPKNYLDSQMHLVATS